MAIIKSQLDTRSDDFRANSEAYQRLLDELRAALADVREGGKAEARHKHGGRGKLFVRERIERLLDPDTPFLELSPLAAHEVYEDEVPSAGIITGVGRVEESPYHTSDRLVHWARHYCEMSDAGRAIVDRLPPPDGVVIRIECAR